MTWDGVDAAGIVEAQNIGFAVPSGQVREFLDKELPERFRGTMDRMAGGGGGDMRSRFEEMKEWRNKLSDKGWIAAAWPKEYGGAGLGTMEQFIMNEEFAENRTPPVGGMGVSMIGPTLIIHGDEDIIIPSENAKILRDRIAGSTAHIMPGVGHVVIWEEPKESAEVIVKFLSSVPAPA